MLKHSFNLEKNFGQQIWTSMTQWLFWWWFFVILWFFLESNVQCKIHFIKKKIASNAKWKHWPKKNLLNTSRKKFELKINKILIVNLNMLLSFWMTKTMFNLMIREDKYEKVLTWNCEIGHDRIDYAKISPIQAMISHHWNII